MYGLDLRDSWCSIYITAVKLKRIQSDKSGVSHSTRAESIELTLMSLAPC